MSKALMTRHIASNVNNASGSPGISAKNHLYSDVSVGAHGKLTREGVARKIVCEAIDSRNAGIGMMHAWRERRLRRK